MKPTKPYPTFPLTPHIRGGWVKKYKGRLLYLSPSDPDAALREFHAKASAIDAGQEPVGRVCLSDVTVGEIVQRYCRERRLDHQAGRLSQGALQDYRDAAFEMERAFGADTRVDHLTPDHFTSLFRTLDSRLGAHALGRMIQNCRTIWKHADDNRWISRTPRFGSVFKKPLTERKHGTPFTDDEVGRLIVAANGQLRAMLLLMANCGFNNIDCGTLKRSAVDLDKGIIIFPRPKLARRRGVDRACTLWPETVDSLRDVMTERPDDDLVFRTAHGNPWVRVDGISKNGKPAGVDSLYLMFRRLCKPIGVPVRGPAWLRHWFSTTADQVEKPHAKCRIMGHKLPGLEEVYVDSVEHSRLQFITDHVRGKLQAHLRRLGKTSPAAAAPAGADRPQSAG